MKSNKDTDLLQRSFNHFWFSAVSLLILALVIILQEPVLLALLFFATLLLWYSIHINFKYRDFHLVGFLIFSSIVLPPITAFPGPDIRVEELFYFLVFPLLIIYREKPAGDRYLTYFSYSVLAFGAAIVLSLNYGKYFLGVPTSINDYFELLKVLKLFIIVITISRFKLSKQEIYRLLYIVVFSFLLSAFIGLLQFYGLFGFDRITAPYYFAERIFDIYNRMMGTFFNPNTYGTAVTLGIIVTMVLFFYERSPGRKLFLVISAGIFAFTIALTQSRTALIVLLISFLSILFLNISRRQLSVKQITAILGFTTFLLLIIVSLLSEQIITRFISLADISEDMSWNMRLLAWYLNMQLFFDSYLLGWGPAKIIHTSIVDSEYILILRRYGIIGFSIYILTYLIPIVRAYIMSRKEGIKELIGQIIVVGTLVFLIANITNPLFHEIQFMDFWALMLGVFFALPLTENESYT